MWMLIVTSYVPNTAADQAQAEDTGLPAGLWVLPHHRTPREEPEVHDKTARVIKVPQV